MSRDSSLINRTYRPRPQVTEPALGGLGGRCAQSNKSVGNREIRPPKPWPIRVRCLNLFIQAVTRAYDSFRNISRSLNYRATPIWGQ